MAAVNQAPVKEDSLGVLSIVGPTKHTDEQFVHTFLFVLAKMGESIAISNNVDEIDTKADFLLNFILDGDKQEELRKDKIQYYNDLVKEYKDEHNQQLPNDATKILYKRQAANRMVGKINIFFDEVWGLQRNLKIAIAGPRGPGDQRFIPIKLLPEEMQKKLADAMGYPKKRNMGEDDE